jgi:hypothetical protein
MGRPKGIAEKYIGNELCEYGCNKVAKYKFKNGKLCCASQGANCSSRRKLAGEKISKSRNIEIEPGVTNAKLIADKISFNKYKNVDDNGMNMHQRGAIKSALTKYNTVDDKGVNIHQLNGIKYSRWINSDLGKETVKNLSLLSKEKQNVINDDGIKEAKRRAIKMVETKLNDIDENGMNSFERAHWKYNRKHCGLIEGVYYQYSNEKRFLLMMKDNNKIHLVKRGKPIKYEYNKEIKTYLPDYVIGDDLYEIKSTYTLFGPNDKFLDVNISKLNAAKECGYNVHLVVDDVIIKYEDFLNTQRGAD